MPPKYRSWSEVQEAAMILADRLKEYGKFDRVVALANGGLVPARLIADLLNIETIQLMRVKHYERGHGGEKSSVQVQYLGLNDYHGGNPILVIDDLFDTGESMRVAIARLRSAGFDKIVAGALYTKMPLNELADKLGTMMFESAIKVDKNEFMIYPWEINELKEQLKAAC